MKKTLIAALVGMAISAGALAADNSYNVGLKMGTLGAGIDVSRAISESVSLRGNFNFLKYDKNIDESGVSYRGNIDMMTLGLLADWRPFHNGFRVSGGVYANKNKASLNANASNGTIRMNGVDYPTGDAGVDSLDASVKFRTFAPYVGIGYAGPVVSGSRWSVITDLGMMYQGSPKVSMDATCGASLNAASCQQVQTEAEIVRNDLTDDLSGFKWLPVASVGVSYRF